MTKIFIIIVFVLLGISIFALLICRILYSWFEFNKGTDVRIRFKQFLSLYSVCPDKYEPEEDQLRYGRPFNHTFIGFSYFDYLRYQRWLKNTEKEEERKQKLNEKQKFLESVQRDLDEYRRQAAIEVEELKTKLGV